MKNLFIILLLLSNLSAFTQVQEPEQIDYTGLYLRQSGTRAVTGPCIAMIGGVITGAAYYYDPSSEFVILGLAISAVGVGISLSGGVSLIRAGRQYELNHKTK